MRQITARIAVAAAVLAVTFAADLAAQTIVPSRGVDPRVDYSTLTRFGPWDDRNYSLTQEDLELLSPEEAELLDPIPAFYRVELRKRFPELQRTGPAQYPFSAVPRFLLEHGGYLIDGKIYQRVERGEDGRLTVVLEDGVEVTEGEEPAAALARTLDGESRVSSPAGAAESAVAINPVSPELVVAGSNGPGGGQKMHFSTDGGATWSPSAALPLGGTCCDPTVAWSSDGTVAYAATLGSSIWVYRSADGGATWDDLANEPGNNPRRSFGAGDKEFLHVDHSPTSPHRDNVYLTWHVANVLQFARSSDFGHTWSIQAVSSGNDQLGLGSDITTDADGNVYYFWPAYQSRKIWVRKSTDGGASFEPVVEVASTEASFIFTIPAQANRGAAVVLSADADRSGGSYAGSVYAAWTDSTGPTSTNPSTNHARVRVAYSRDGGDTWTVTTPHETDDAETVDRWQPFIAVGTDGVVHLIMNDTRLDPSRASIDLFYTRSIDGGVTWATPQRLTSVTSPAPSDSFQFGDYSGLDVAMNRLIGVYTDNRDESGGSAQSKDIYAVGQEAAEVLFADGFESGDTSAWSGSGG
jgi:hypothetical protein